jgi:hypothetical protein
MNATTQNYLVLVYIDGQERTAVFHRTNNGRFDLRYGWMTFTTKMSDSLNESIQDFLTVLKKKNPGKEVSAGTPQEITEIEAKTFSPGLEPSEAE